MRSKLSGHLPHLIAAFSAIVALTALLYGPGLLSRPKIVLSTAAIDLKIPSKFKRDLFFLRMLLEKPDIAHRANDSMAKMLRDSGLSEERVALILRNQGEDVHLEPYEENLVNAALAKATTELQSKMLESLTLPEAVLFFEVRNEGGAAAQKVHVIAMVRGTPYETSLTTENRVNSEKTIGSEYRLDFDSIAPGSITRCTIWYSRTGEDPPESNEVVVVHERGTTRQVVPEGSVILGWK